MNALKAFAIILMIAGGLGLAYGGFSYTKNTQQAKIGPLELSIKETETINIPVWAGLSALIVGAVVLFARK